MLLLWVELKKLFGRGLRLAAGLFLVLGVLNSGLGESMVLASSGNYLLAGNAPPLDGTKLVHLQLFGGLFHLHEGTDEAHHHADNLTVPDGVVQFVFPPITSKGQSDPYQLSGNFTSLSGTDYTSDILLVIAPKYQGDGGLASLPPLSFVTRHLPTDLAQPPDPFLSPPDKPPYFLNLPGLRVK